LVVDDEMCMTDRIGWYAYTYQTDCDRECGIGIYRVDVTLCTSVMDDCFSAQTTGSIGTSGTSGSTTPCCDVAVSYFRVNERARY